MVLQHISKGWTEFYNCYETLKHKVNKILMYVFEPMEALSSAHQWQWHDPLLQKLLWYFNCSVWNWDKGFQIKIFWCFFFFFCLCIPLEWTRAQKGIFIRCTVCMHNMRCCMFMYMALWWRGATWLMTLGITSGVLGFQNSDSLTHCYINHSFISA